MTSLSNLRQRSVYKDKLFEMMGPEMKVQGRKYQILSNFGIFCRESGGLKGASFRACVQTFCSVVSSIFMPEIILLVWCSAP